MHSLSSWLPQRCMWRYHHHHLCSLFSCLRRMMVVVVMSKRREVRKVQRERCLNEESEVNVKWFGTKKKKKFVMITPSVKEREGETVCVGEGDLSSVILVIKETLTHELNPMWWVEKRRRKKKKLMKRRDVEEKSNVLSWEYMVSWTELYVIGFENLKYTHESKSHWKKEAIIIAGEGTFQVWFFCQRNLKSHELNFFVMIWNGFNKERKSCFGERGGTCKFNTFFQGIVKICDQTLWDIY